MKAITAEESRTYDRIASRRYGIPSRLLMETAGQAVAKETLRVHQSRRARLICVLCGRGLNGGDGLVAARFLLCEGVEPRVVLFGPDPDQGLSAALAALPEDARVNAALLHTMGARMELAANPDSLLTSLRARAPELILVDALLGVGLRGDVRHPLSSLLEGLETLDAFRISVDLPSGLDADDGTIHGHALRADCTVSFVAPKRGLLVGAGPSLAGDVVVAPLGLPWSVLNASATDTSGTDAPAKRSRP